MEAEVNLDGRKIEVHQFISSELLLFIDEVNFRVQVPSVRPLADEGYPFVTEDVSRRNCLRRDI